MSKLNARDGTPGQAASPYVFASVLGASGEEAEVEAGGVDEGLFKWFGTSRPVRNSTMLDTPQARAPPSMLTAPPSEMVSNAHQHFSEK